MDDADRQRLLSDVSRLDGVLDELQGRLHELEKKLDHTSYRLFKMAVLTGAGLAALLALTGSMYLSNYF